MVRSSGTRLKRPVFWLKYFLKIHHFLSLINHSPSRHGPHALCLKSIFKKGKLKECLQISLPKSLLDQMVWPLESLKYVLRHWPNSFAICSRFRSNRTNFPYVGKLPTFSQFSKKTTLEPWKLSTHSHLL